MERNIGRKILNVLPLVLVVLSFILLREKLPAAIDALRRARPIALAALGLFLLWNHFATLSWRTLLVAVGLSPPPVGQLARYRIEAQAVNQLVPAAGLAGEAMRTVAAAGPGEVGSASLATVLDNVAGTTSGVVFAVFAVVLHLQTAAGRPQLLSLLATAAPAAILLILAVVLPFPLAARWSSRSSSSGTVGKLLRAFADNRREIRRAFRDAVGLRFVERVLSAVEVYVVFTAVGAHISASDAALISAVFVLVSFSVFFIPGQLGAAEAAVATASVLIGVPAALGLSAALLRRARQLVVCVVGVLSLLLRRSRTEPVVARPSPEEAP
jgi:uncharacterized membrane protein YbhN (UPF0104 family)